MKKLALGIVAMLIAAVLIFILIERACDEGPTDSELQRIEGQYEEYKAEVKAEEAEWKKERGRLETTIKGLTKEAETWEEASNSRLAVIARKDRAIAKLKEDYEGLEDKGEKIKNLLAQNIQLKQRGDSAIEGWQAEKQANLRLKGIINTKDIIILKLDRQIENKNALLKLSEKLVATQKKRIKSLKLGRTLSQVLAVGGVSVALYQTLLN